MKIIIDLHEQQLSSVVSDGVFYAQTETTIDLATQSGEEGAFNGVSCALLAPDGVTLAHAIASENKAILNTNTAEAVAFVAGYPVGTEKMAFIVVGDSDKPLAIIAVNVSPNPLADIAPPSALAPTYPTSESLRAILSQMTAQAQRAEDAVEATEEAQKAVAQYVDVTFPSKVQEAEKTLENATKASVQAVAKKGTDAIEAVGTYASKIETALDGKLATANTAINDAVGKAETAKGDAVKAQESASKSAEQASTSASNASKSAEQAKTSEENAKATADALNAGLATLNSFDGRVSTLETQVAPTMAGGLLDVKVGHNAMVKVCEFGKVGRATATELVKPFGYTLNSNTKINCIGVGNVWMLHFPAARNVAFICDSDLNYKTAIDVYNEFYDEVPRPNGLPIAGYSTSFTGRCWAVNADSSRIYNVMPEFRSATSTTPQVFIIQSWSLVEEYELDESGKVKLDANGKKIVKYAVGQKIAVKKHALREERLNMYLALNLTYLTNAKMVCVGADILLNQDTLELVGYVDDATTQAGNVSVIKNRYTANQAYAKKSGYGTTFNGTRLVVYYGDGIAPIYVDDLTDPSKPTLRNFVDASGKVVTQAYSHFACAELNNNWANQQTYLMRIVSNKLVTRRVEITFPSDTATISMVVADEKTSGVDLSGYVSIITAQGFFNTSLNKNQVLAIIAYGGAIVQQVTIDSKDVVSPSMPAIDTMTNQSDMKASATPKFTRQTDYGVIITQSGAVGAIGDGVPSISVILNRPTK